jgi:hypothetical protein
VSFVILLVKTLTFFEAALSIREAALHFEAQPLISKHPSQFDTSKKIATTLCLDLAPTV